MSTTTNECLQRLRQATREEHAAVEGALPFFAPKFSLPEYVAILERFLGLFEPMEERLAVACNWTAMGLQFEGRRRAGMLKRDLASLGKSEAEIRAIPSCTFLPELQNGGAALGCLYVLEGSTLGGAFIARAMGKRFGLTLDRGLLFFTTGGRDAKGLWEETKALLCRQLTSERVQIEAENAAKATFACFERWLKTETVQA